jgi:predicted aldo/keto reductase-like oxidoreductase
MPTSEYSRPAVPTRRFGRTELKMPVFSCGGMRYQHSWKDADPSEIPAESQENLEATIHRSLELGINHIETARGYGTSEMQLGWLLPKLPREKMIVQTKVAPSENPTEFLENFEKSMSYLKLDHVDLLAFHGVNTQELLDQVLRKGGCLEVARQLQKDGRANFIGFSTHATTDVITRANESGEFDYVNLHWYFVNELNWPSIEAATQNDMGVFIISPVDKGGKLYEPPQKLVELSAPLSPMQFNDLWCLQRPEVHTLSIGAARPSDFDEHVAALEYSRSKELLAQIEARWQNALLATWGEDWLQNWPRGLPEHFDIVGDVNVLEILRLLTYAKGLDLVEWGKMRYNLLGNAGHWFPGENSKKLEAGQWSQLQRDVSKSPFAARIPSLLQEAHELFFAEEVKRQSESD